MSSQRVNVAATIFEKINYKKLKQSNQIGQD